MTDVKVVFNREEREYEEGTTLADLMEEYKSGQSVSHVGAWRNGKMVRPALHSETLIEDGDTVEIKRFASGG